MHTCFVLYILILIGEPKNMWKLMQQAGRVGRSGQPSVEIIIVYPRKGIT